MATDESITGFITAMNAAKEESPGGGQKSKPGGTGVYTPVLLPINDAKSASDCSEPTPVTKVVDFSPL